jgi:hypothetical protein
MNGLRYCPISASANGRITAPGNTCATKTFIAHDHVVAGRRAKSAEHVSGEFRKIDPRQGHHDGFQIGDTFHAVAALVSPIEAERGAPVGDHESDLVVELELI